MSYGNRLGGRRTTFRARVRAVFRKRPVAYAATASLLLGLAILTVLLYWMKGLNVFGLALVHLAPALIVTLTNFRCRLAGRPADWPRWLLIIGLLNVAIAVGVLVLGVDSGDQILAVTLVLAMPILVGTTVPRLFSTVERALERIPRLDAKLTKWLSAPTLYAWSLVSLILLLAFLWGGFWGALLDGSILAIAFAALLGIACVLSVLTRRTLWASGPLLRRWLPHIPAWIILTWFLAVLIGLDRRIDFDLVLITIVLTTPVAVFYWALLRLRRSPVNPLPEGHSDRAESIQSRVEHYTDVAGYSNRLQEAVRRSDGGVFGVTGVRGAGKSALTRHLLAQLEHDYFTLEVTAPPSATTRIWDSSFPSAAPSVARPWTTWSPFYTRNAPALVENSGSRSAIRCWFCSP
ncbi:hypothetical protein [Candidatus Thiosymbion oneisti]|uniref:hypothetical protein n=1 Tax=Candidatus Thiosymbion oneisti TaxID=589554 RepID=UPI00105EC425|nr:hypothetical protein [Candidatus Thiosymbion oneisti]